MLSTFLNHFNRNERGNITLMAALTSPIVLGAFGVGAEVASWYENRRAQQDASDSAVVAASTNGGANFDVEAKAVAAQYGFQDGVSGVHVTASNTATCPSGGNTCYSINISKPQPLLLSGLVGYGGDATLAGAPAKLISATSIAKQSVVSRSYCLLALASSGAAGIHTNGAPKANLSGCNIMSNTTATCNGHNLGADVGDAHGSNSGCGVTANSNAPTVGDPYVGLQVNIPANPCSSYPQIPGKKGAPLPASNQLSGSLSWSGTKIVCGDAQLTGNVTLTTTGVGAVLVIENGQLDTGGSILRTAAGSSLTIIFSGTAAGAYTHAPTGGGTLDIKAPSSGVWSGVALYQDPNLISGVDIAAAGNSPTWDITGLVYLPHSSVTFSGAVNKSSNGQSCFTMVVDNILINGTGSILANGQCGVAGLNMPASSTPGRGALVS